MRDAVPTTRSGRSGSSSACAGMATTRQSVDQAGRGGSPIAGRPGRGRRPPGAAAARSRTSPSTTTSDQTTFFMASSGATHGPPAALHPADVATANSSPSSSAVAGGSSASRHAAEPGRTASGTTRGTPMPPSKSWTPRTPTSCSHVRSRTTPAGSTLPSIQCHQARGRASSGGSMNASQRSAASGPDWAISTPLHGSILTARAGAKGGAVTYIPYR